MVAALALALRGDSSSLCRVSDPRDLETVIETAARFGVEPLIRTVLQGRGEWASVPAGLRTAFDASAHREVAIEALRSRETRRVLAGLHAAGVATLVLKGAALAYTHYPAPYLRARADTDLLVRPADRESAAGALENLGYRRRNSVSRDAIHRQVTFERVEASFIHALDLHWAISNRPLFAEMLSFDELWDDATTIACLGTAARTPGPVHTLLFACIHRVAHHDDSSNPLWLYDIKLLAEGLSDDEWDRFWRLASEKQIVAVCRRSLELTARDVGCSAVSFAGSPSTGFVDAEGEASAAYIGGSGSRWRNLVLNVRGAAGIQAKIQLLAAYAFPDATYMRTAHGAKGPASLAAAYLRRAWAGLRRLISPRVW